MRILLHDYAGHPFQIQLSRGLAARGHEVLHLFCGSTHTPRGELARRVDDPPEFQIREISLGETIPKNSFIRRYRLEATYGRLLADACRQWNPDVVLSANTPSVSQYRLTRVCRQQNVRLVSWIQDIYGIAAQRLLRRKLPVIGSAVGRYFIRLDQQCARQSDAIVVITSDFRDVMTGWGVAAARVHVIHNWAPLENMPLAQRENDWSRKLQPRGENSEQDLRLVYSGTLAMKHNPRLLLELARSLQDHRLGELIVVSEGAGVEWLAQHAAAEGITALRCLGFQPFEQLPQVLASADVLVAILEPDAGVFSVPSKVLTYLCAARPLLLAVPRENLAAKIVTECGGGVVVEPHDVAGFCQAALELAGDPARRAELGRAAREYAEGHFDISAICDQFEAILQAPRPDHAAGR